MMEGGLLALGSALWLGILTSLSPCPLATNLAAVSFIGRQLAEPRRVFLGGLSYALGRALGYLGLAAILVGSLLTAPRLSEFLQHSMNQILGPVLLLAGMVLLGLLRLPLPSRGLSSATAERLGRWGEPGAFLLGLLFALSFCPVSAAIFFGSLLPLATREESRLLLPGIYGLGTGLPVLALGVALALGARGVGTLLHRLAAVEKGARWLTGGVFLAVGLYLCAVHVFGLSL